MYTVVIAEQKHLDSIREYDLFLQPFLDHSDTVFCAWNPEGTTLRECVPELRGAVKRGDKWRAILVMDEGGRTLKNPFDRVQHHDPVWDTLISDEENRAHRMEARFASFETAAQMPFSRLVAYLCDYPALTGEHGLLSEDPDYQDYRRADTKKKELQKQILGTEPQDFLKPTEVICVARRTLEDESYDIRTSWVPHLDLEYSRFAEYNLYYPKMRYIVIDVLPTNHRNYRFDNVKFLYALILLAGNDIPNDALQAGRVYNLSCENDNRNLSRLLQQYDDRLLATQKMLESEISLLKNDEVEPITDKEMRASFLSPTNIALRFQSNFDESELYVKLRRFGLFSDKPEDEKTLWSQEQRRSKKYLQEYMRQPKKAIRAAVADVHLQSQNQEGVEKAFLLNEQQLGEFHDYLQEEEAATVASQPLNLTDASQFLEKMDDAAEKVDRHLETRMTRKTGLIAIGIALIAFLVGMIPAFFAGRMQLPVVLAIAASFLLLIVISVVCLFVQRGKVRGVLRGYNDVLHNISGTIQNNMGSYATFLSHVCSLRKGNAVDNALNEGCDDVQNRCKVYKKHIIDIRNLRADWGLTFSQFLQAGQEQETDAQPFRFDYRSTNTIRYPFAADQERSAQVEFLQKGNYIELPVDYIRKVELRREELYD